MQTTSRVAPQPPPSRDPNGINKHIKIQFHDVIGEPKTPQSLDITWEFSKICYDCWKALCYGLLTLCCSPCVACMWAYEFAFLAFSHIWCLTPIFLQFKMWCGSFQRCVRPCINCFIVPCTNACGRIFHLLPVKRKPPPADNEIIIGKKSDVTKTIQRQLGLFMR